MSLSRKSRIAAGAAALAILSVGTSLVLAGATEHHPVRITTTPTGLIVVEGALGTARNSADDYQRIGCRHFMAGKGDGSIGGPHVVECFAETVVNGEYAAARCRTYSNPQMAIASTLTGDSYLYFSYQPADGLCQEIRVETSSVLEPKAH